MLARMAIRFQCPSCRQPIEIDDPWAEKPVACPFCRKTVLAPAESSLNFDHVPVATPLTSPYSASAAGDHLAAADSGRRSSLPVWAVAMAIAAFVLPFVPYLLFPQDMKQFEGPDAYQRLTDDIGKGQMPKGIEKIAVVGLLTLLCWVGGVVCGFVSLVRYRSQRALAITALSICGLLLLMNCAGTLFLR
jgi:hypothetical protein